MGNWPKLDFWTQNLNFGPKKRVPLFYSNHVLATTGKSCSKKKVPFSKTNISLLRNFGCFFLDKTHFWPKNYFSAERIKGRFSLILARTGSVFILEHFLMARTVPTSFSENNLKLRVIILMKWHKPKKAKNRGEPLKITQSSETEIFFGMVRRGNL